MASNKIRTNYFLFYVHVTIEALTSFAEKQPPPTDKISRFICNEDGHIFAWVLLCLRHKRDNLKSWPFNGNCELLEKIVIIDPFFCAYKHQIKIKIRSERKRHSLLTCLVKGGWLLHTFSGGRGEPYFHPWHSKLLKNLEYCGKTWEPRSGRLD